LPNFHSFFAPQLLQNILIIRINLLNRLILTYQGANFYILPYNLEHKGLILSRNLILAGLYLGLCGSFLTYILIQYAIKYLSPLTVNLSSYIQPILTTAMAMILLGEKLTMTFLFGSMMVLFGVFISATLEFYFRNTHK